MIVTVTDFNLLCAGRATWMTAALLVHDKSVSVAFYLEGPFFYIRYSTCTGTCTMSVVVLVCRIEFLRTLSLMQSEFHSEAFSKWTRYCHSTVLRAESTVRTFPFLLAFHFPGFSICGFTYATHIPQDNLAFFLICSFKNSITTQDQTLTINQKCQVLNLTSNLRGILLTGLTWWQLRFLGSFPTNVSPLKDSITSWYLPCTMARTNIRKVL